MDSGAENFYRLGHRHLLNSLDWRDAHDRRSVAASLCKGVRLLEKDRQARWLRPKSQRAPPWWEFLKFKLFDRLVDNHGIIFGAIFEYKPKAEDCARHRSIDRSPRYVVGFRGSLLGAFLRELKTSVRDVLSDINIIRNELHKDTRFEIALKTVQDLVVKGDLNIWLTGHSLGAAMGMLVGKNMAKRGNFLESFLFNPPFVSPPIERIESEGVRSAVRSTGTLIKTGFGIGFELTAAGKKYRDSFAAISGWIPHLYVNQLDIVCGEYIAYFEHRRKLEDGGLGYLARVSSQHSLGNIVMSAVGITDLQTSEPPLHLLPSAKLIVDLNPSRNAAHKLSEWWRTDLNLSCTVYEYK